MGITVMTHITLRKKNAFSCAQFLHRKHYIKISLDRLLEEEYIYTRQYHFCLARAVSFFFLFRIVGKLFL